MIKEETRQRPRRIVLVLLAMAVATVLASFAAVQPAHAAFPGKNGKIAFQSDRDGNDEIYTMKPDGTKQTNLSKNQAQDSLPAVSADGKKIAFASNREGNFEVYLMDVAPEDPTINPPQNLTNNSASDSLPAFSPDGKKFAFVSSEVNDNSNVFVMDTDPATNDAKNLSNIDETDLGPSFSPSGKQIVFSGTDRDGFFHIFVMNASDGSNKKKLTKNRAADVFPDWGVAPQK